MTLEISRSTLIGNDSKIAGKSVYIPGDDTIYIMGDYSYATLQQFLAEIIFEGSLTITPNSPVRYGSDAIEVLVDTLFLPLYDLEAMASFLNGFSTGITNL